MLDNIESNLIDANDYVEKAETKLMDATKIHQKSRSKMCLVLLCIAILVIGVLVYFFVF